jgi:glutamyl-tRNA synthetase
VSGRVDDFVVRRNDGDFGYNLAVTVDDAAQGITEVVRGADLLETTGRQLWLYDRLGLGQPSTWIHVPLMFGDDGARLAKRHGAVTLEERLTAGQTVGEVVSELLGAVGLSDPGYPLERPVPEILEELARGFSWDPVKAHGVK